MFAPALRIAAGKATGVAMRDALDALVARAQLFDAAEVALPETIAQRKAARGEQSPVLKKGTREMLDGFTQDQQNIQADILATFEASEDAATIVWSLGFALRSDVQRSEGLLKHYPEADRPIGVEQQQRKRDLLAALDAFLAEFQPASEV